VSWTENPQHLPQDAGQARHKCGYSPFALIWLLFTACENAICSYFGYWRVLDTFCRICTSEMIDLVPEEAISLTSHFLRLPNYN
jgi:hypothetical protein